MFSQKPELIIVLKLSEAVKATLLLSSTQSLFKVSVSIRARSVSFLSIFMRNAGTHYANFDLTASTLSPAKERISPMKTPIKTLRGRYFYRNTQVSKKTILFL